jgi:hypothetical protein
MEEIRGSSADSAEEVTENEDARLVDLLSDSTKVACSTLIAILLRLGFDGEYDA